MKNVQWFLLLTIVFTLTGMGGAMPQTDDASTPTTQTSGSKSTPATTPSTASVQPSPTTTSSSTAVTSSSSAVSSSTPGPRPPATVAQAVYSAYQSLFNRLTPHKEKLLVSKDLNRDKVSLYFETPDNGVDQVRVITKFLDCEDGVKCEEGYYGAGIQAGQLKGEAYASIYLGGQPHISRASRFDIDSFSAMPKEENAYSTDTGPASVYSFQSPAFMMSNKMATITANYTGELDGACGAAQYAVFWYIKYAGQTVGQTAVYYFGGGDFWQHSQSFGNLFFDTCYMQYFPYN